MPLDSATMDEPSGNSVVSRKSKYFTDIKSSYSLRKTPARSDSVKKSKPVSDSAKKSSPGSSNSSKSQLSETPEPLFPPRNRVSAIHNSKCTKENNVVEIDESQELESRKFVKGVLLEFREIYDKVIRKEGDTLRPSVMAYNILKDKKKNELSNVTKRVGRIPGIEIGDEFKFRVEMFLIGLHQQLQNIDYVSRDGRFIATSLVFTSSGSLSNSVHVSDDVLVCSGSGNAKKHQQMEGGNLALKNSMEDKNPIRVVLGLGKKKGTQYVYSGLYFVEKYWEKKAHQDRRVFWFQLRRLIGQAKLDVKGVMKSISSSTGSKDVEDKTLSKCSSQESCKAKSLGKRKREEKEKGEEFHDKEYQYAESRKRTKNIIYEFLSTYEKLAENDKVKKMKKKCGRKLRFDIDAYNILKSKNKDLRNVKKCLGTIPGVEVGDKFHFRVELALLGLHCHLHNDIDVMTNEKKLLATSIVSTRFDEFSKNAFKSDSLLFCGNGLKNTGQKMVNSNLALKNNIEAEIPVRVFNGLRINQRATLYVYCGLYVVENYWRKKNADGYAFMFQLKRLPDQRKINFEEAKNLLSLQSHSAPKYNDDISRGKEKIPIRVVNTIDKEKLVPFEYTTEVIHSSKYNPIPLEGCKCTDGCMDSNTCACAVRNGGELPFNSNGLIVEAKPLIYECGPHCKCPPSCHNRVSQHGLRFPLEVFKTKTMGWGVRSKAFIPSGSFICEYVGELLEDEEAQKRSTDDYMFAIGNNYYDESLWGGFSSVPCLEKHAPSDAEYDGGFNLDSSRYGNIGRLINHSCTPNLYAQNVLNDHDDKRMPRVMFFACEDIPPLQELSYHYNYTIDDVHDSDGNIRKKSCYCGSIECTGRLY